LQRQFTQYQKIATEIVDKFEQGTYGVTTNAERSTPSTPVKIYVVEVQITRLDTATTGRYIVQFTQ
jgi:hypothetical protein